MSRNNVSSEELKSFVKKIFEDTGENISKQTKKLIEDSTKDTFLSEEVWEDIARRSAELTESAKTDKRRTYEQKER